MNDYEIPMELMWYWPKGYLMEYDPDEDEDSEEADTPIFVEQDNTDK